MSETIYGIDLGTTNSVIARLEQGKTEIIPIENSNLVPSVVSFQEDEILVGQRARNRAMLSPEVTVQSAKREMGSGHIYHLQNLECSPEEVSSHILKYLATEAGRSMGTEIKRVVITVPAYFSDAQRRDTVKAGQLAGLHVERIINEPTAAALFYDQLNMIQSRENGEENLLVYDLGGGTFDVSVLRVGEITEVLASTGNVHLGGDDFDQKIMDWCLEHIKTEHHQDLHYHPPALARIKDAAEKAKIELSTKTHAFIEESFLPNPSEQTLHLNLELDRIDFENMISEYLQATRKEVQKGIQEAGLDYKDIDRVIPVGGCTRIPAVISLLEDLFGSARMPTIDPDLCVARGAAIQGGIILGSHVDQILVDITAHTLSTEALVGMTNFKKECVPIIPRNTQIPVVRAKEFFTIAPSQEKILVNVYQGESFEPEENTLIGSMDLALAPSPDNSPIIIEFSYDLNGIIRVKAEQKGYSRKREVDLDVSLKNQIQVDLDTEEENEPEDLPETNEDTTQSEVQITNYILHKARQKESDLPEGTEKEYLQTLIQDYAQALGSDDEDWVDRAEDSLVDYLDELDSDAPEDND